MSACARVCVRGRETEIWVVVSNVFFAAVVEVPKCLKTVALKKLLYVCHRVIAYRFFFFCSNSVRNSCSNMYVSVHVNLK